MRHWQADHLRCRDPGLDRGLFLSRSDLGIRVKIHPAYIPWPATYGGSWLHLAAREDQVPTAE